LVKISRNSMITQRIGKLKETVKVDKQRLRGKALEGLEELFDLAQAVAKSQNVKPIRAGIFHEKALNM